MSKHCYSSLEHCDLMRNVHVQVWNWNNRTNLKCWYSLMWP